MIYSYEKHILLLGTLSFLVTTSCATKVVTTAPDKAVIVKKAPQNHSVVYVNGKKYYRWKGNHYRKTRRGFVIVKI